MLWSYSADVSWRSKNNPKIQNKIKTKEQKCLFNHSNANIVIKRNIIFFHHDDFEIVNEHLSTGKFALGIIFHVMLCDFYFSLWKKCSGQRKIGMSNQRMKKKNDEKSKTAIRWDAEAHQRLIRMTWLFIHYSYSCHSVSGRFFLHSRRFGYSIFHPLFITDLFRNGNGNVNVIKNVKN